MIKSVTIFGGNELSREDYLMMEKLGAILGQKKIKIITGGFDGAMEAPAKGAKRAGGVSIGYTYLNKPGNKYLTKIIDCSTGKKKELAPENQWTLRLANLIKSDAFIVAPDGKLGTWVEILAVINSNKKMWKQPKKVCFLDTRNFWERNLSWAKKLELFPSESSWLGFFSDPREAVDWIMK